MKTLWMATFLLMLSGCNQDGSGTMAPPTAIYFGDSITLGISGPARLDLDRQVDFRHDSWEAEDIAPSDTAGYYQNVAVSGRNNGCSATMVRGMRERLPGTYYGVLVMEVGAHDFQQGVVDWAGAICGQVPIDVYRTHLEEAASIAESHAAVVIMPDIEPIPAGVPKWGNAGVQVPYNQVIHEVAREHGFYMLEPEWPTARYAEIHFTLDGYKSLGKQLADCVLTALNQAETDRCHH